MLLSHEVFAGTPCRWCLSWTAWQAKYPIRAGLRHNSQDCYCQDWIRDAVENILLSFMNCRHPWMIPIVGSFYPKPRQQHSPGSRREKLGLGNVGDESHKKTFHWYHCIFRDKHEDFLNLPENIYSSCKWGEIDKCVKLNLITILFVSNFTGYSPTPLPRRTVAGYGGRRQKKSPGAPGRPSSIEMSPAGTQWGCNKQAIN